LDDLTTNSGEWLRGSGPEADISSAAAFDWRATGRLSVYQPATPQDRARIEKILHERFWPSPPNRIALRQRVATGEVDRQFLVERHLISREHAEAQGARAVAIDCQKNSV